MTSGILTRPQINKITRLHRHSGAAASGTGPPHFVFGRDDGSIE